jgi:N-acetylglucosamine-6-phosphate deacetylase
LHIADRTGSLEAGKQADILLLDGDLKLQGVWIKGLRK